MNTTMILLLAAGGIILFWPQISQAFNLAVVPAQAIDPFAPGYVGPSPSGRDDLRITGPLAPGASDVGRQVIPSVDAGAGAVASALGLTAAVAAGIAAAGGILAWGIITRGWFRGGEEALFVNPARDEFKSLFAHLNPYSDACANANGPGFFGLAWLLSELGRSDLMTKFNRADTRQEFEAAVSDIDVLLARSVNSVRALVDYTKRNRFPGAACTPNPNLPWETQTS